MTPKQLGWGRKPLKFWHKMVGRYGKEIPSDIAMSEVPNPLEPKKPPEGS